MILFPRIRTFLVGLPLVLAGIVLCPWGYAWYEGERIHARVALIKRNGLPTNLKELAPAEVADVDNADFLIRQALPSIHAIELEFAKFPSIDGGEMSDEIAAKLTVVFAANSELFANIERAANCEHYIPNLDYDAKPQDFSVQSLEHVNNLRNAARIMNIRMKVLVQVGNPEEAAAIGINGLRLCGRLKQPRLMTDLIVVLASRGILMNGLNEVLQTSNISPESHRRIADELSLFDPQKELRASLVQERAYSLAAIADQGIAVWIHANAVLDLLEQEIDSANQEEFLYQFHDVPDDWQTVLAKQLQPSLLSTRQTVSGHVATQRCLQIVNAWKAAGAPADATIEQLVSDKVSRRDPYTGTDLIVRVLPEGLLVYSVGSDRRDGGGQVETGKDRGWTHPKKETVRNELNDHQDEPGGFRK